MTELKAFFCEGLMRRRFYLRRYSAGSDRCQKSDYGCTSEMVPVAEFDEDFVWRKDTDGYELFPEPRRIDHANPKWPTLCERCGKPFEPSDLWQVMQERLFRRVDTGELIAQRYLPPGALWYADRAHTGFADVFPGGGPDGLVLCAMCPGDQAWCIDSRASNCGLPKDDKHRCWVRHGDPVKGEVHVDKAGLTCKAGAGSIKTSNWHGFLDHGYFREKRAKKP